MYGYIYHDHHLTKDDVMIICRRTFTAAGLIPITESLGNGYKETFWHGDISKELDYKESNLDYINNGICTV